MISARTFLLLPFVAATLSFCPACSTIIDSHKQKIPMMEAYMAGDNTRAEKILDGKLSSTKGAGDELMWQLESGSFRFGLGKYADSLRAMEKAEALFASYDERAAVSLRDAGSEVGSATVNLNVLPYKGFCRDRVMIPVFKALARLGTGNEEGFYVELNRLRVAQTKVIEDNRKAVELEKQETEKERKSSGVNIRTEDIVGDEAFQSVTKQQDEVALKGYGNFLNPLAAFLSGIGFLRNNDPENALVDFKRLYGLMPKNVFAQRLFVSALTAAGRSVPDSLKGVKPFPYSISRNCVYVIFAPGRGAAFRQVKINLIYTGFAFPVCEYYPSAFKTLLVEAGKEKTQTAKIADMDAIFSQEHKERLPLQITRMVISYAVKEAAATAANIAAWNEDPLLGAITVVGTSTYKYIFNTADTRTWEILPKEFQAAVLPMPENRKIVITPVSSGGETLAFKPLEIPLPEQCASALIYIQAPNAQTFKYHVMPIKSK